MKTPKQKSNKKAKEKLSFSQDVSDSEVFDKLMDNLGVSPILENEKEHHIKPKTVQPASDPVEFLIDSDCDIKSADPTIQNKFSGKQKQLRKNKNPKKRKINRNFQPDAKIDLHGNTREEAINRAEQFLQQSILQKYDSILIITGKGTNLENQTGILQKTIWSWLEKQKKEENISFKWAPYFLGGKGAILVFL